MRWNLPSSIVVFATTSSCAVRGTGGVEEGGEVGTDGSSVGEGSNESGENSDGTEDSVESDGNCFVSCFDTFAQPPSCDPISQDCPEGEKCTAYSIDGGGYWNANKCVPIDPAKDQPWDPCMDTDEPFDGLDTCDKGGLCWEVDPDTMVGYCIPFCSGSPADPVCEVDGICWISGDTILPLCMAGCDPLAIDCPNLDNLCIALGDEGFVCVLDASGGIGGHAAGCEYANSCKEGLFCAQPEAVPGCAFENCCSEYCDINLPNSCAGMADGQVCIPWWEMGMAPMGLEHVGGCGVP